MNDYWPVGLLAVLFNIAFWFAMLFVQKWESQTGRIPARKKHNRQNPADSFLYMQDFYTNGPIGDLVGFSLIDMAVVVTMYQQGLSIWMVIPALLATIATYLFYRSCTKPDHKPDWGYLRRGITWGGRAHLLYAVCQGTLIVVSLIFLFTDKMAVIPLILYLVGIIIWGICFTLDLLTKRWSTPR